MDANIAPITLLQSNGTHWLEFFPHIYISVILLVGLLKLTFRLSEFLLILLLVFGVHSALVMISEEVLERKLVAPV
jgi:hypothetical protein